MLVESLRTKTRTASDLASASVDGQAVYQARLKGALLRRPERHRLIDLFAGAGGMSLGFSREFGHSFETVWANDFNRDAASSYNANFGDHCVVADINSVLERTPEVIPRADVVIGGPPCQGFSLLNKKRANDPRKQLWRPFLDVVERSGARVFVMENVSGILGSEEHKEIRGKAEALGFELAWAKLCAADYGVPQVRWRAFIVGCRDRNPGVVFPPMKTHFKPGNGNHQLFEYIHDPEPWVTVREAISDLPVPEGTEINELDPPLDIHFGRNPTAMSRARYRAIPEEGMNRFDLQKRAPQLTPQCWINKKSGGTDLFGRLWWDRPAVTIRTEFFKPEKGRYLHPSEHRPITHREAARFQSFPDNFIFKGTKIEIARQIGNAVPPALAAHVADSVYALLSGDTIDA